jgi:hypothetical protein
MDGKAFCVASPSTTAPAELTIATEMQLVTLPAQVCTLVPAMLGIQVLAFLSRGYLVVKT